MQNLSFYGCLLGPVSYEVLINRAGKENLTNLFSITSAQYIFYRDIHNYFLVMLLRVSGCFQEFNCNPKYELVCSN